MRFILSLLAIGALPLIAVASLSAQNGGGAETLLRDAKIRAYAAERRAEILQQEASSANQAADQLVVERASLSAQIDAAAAQIETAQARVAIINERQRVQRATLGAQSEPILRLNAALQRLTYRPTALMILQPGQRTDYVHLRAVMASVQPEIARRTGALRAQIAAQRTLRAQELSALKSLARARDVMAVRQNALAELENKNRGRADALLADAAIEFEQAIAQGERARDLIEDIDYIRTSEENAHILAALPGPMLRANQDPLAPSKKPGAYALPQFEKLISGFNELNATGYRERGVTLSMAPYADIPAPAAGKISFAGPYRSFGNIVIIEHGGGWNSLVTNLGQLDVKKGSNVKQGDILGKAGTEQPQITMELRRKGRVMDIVAMFF